MEKPAAPPMIAAVGAAVQVMVPALLRVDARENGNTVRQLAVPPWNGNGTVNEFKQGRMLGYTITFSDGSASLLLLTNSAQPSPEWTHVLRLRDAQIVLPSTSLLDLSGARWIKHPKTPPQLAGLADYEEQAADALAS
jgi:hypothetical protein